MPPDLLAPDGRGLYCAAGDFHVDPWKPVPRALITHGHSDHARPGCGAYLTAHRGAAVVRERTGGAGAFIETMPYGETRDVGGVKVSFHPAGHILGSAQIRLQHGGRVWVASGDYKTAPDPTTDPFEAVKCDVFITESTFGLPVFRWRPEAEIMAGINAWWAANQAAGRTSVVFAYALGKAQRVLAGLDPGLGPIVCHGAVSRFIPHYRAAGVALPDTLGGGLDVAKEVKGRAMVVAPPSAAGTPWLRKFGPNSIAFASGWMAIRGARRRRALDAGFVLSDHVDWPGLLAAIEATGAERVGVTHGYTAAVAKWLNEHGREAFTLGTRYEGEQDGDGESDTGSVNNAEGDIDHRTDLSDQTDPSDDAADTDHEPEDA